MIYSHEVEYVCPETGMGKVSGFSRFLDAQAAYNHFVNRDIWCILVSTDITKNKLELAEQLQDLRTRRPN